MTMEGFQLLALQGEKKSYPLTSYIGILIDTDWVQPPHFITMPATPLDDYILAPTFNNAHKPHPQPKDNENAEQAAA